MIGSWQRSEAIRAVIRNILTHATSILNLPEQRPPRWGDRRRVPVANLLRLVIVHTKGTRIVGICEGQKMGCVAECTGAHEDFLQ